MSNKLNEMMDSTVEKIKSTVNADTIIGKPINSADGSTIIPVSKVAYGFAAGGSDFSSQKGIDKDMFGGGNGAGVSITPVAFLVISKDSDVKLLQIQSFDGAIDRIISMAPDVVDKIGNMIKNRKDKKNKSEDE